jgi:beta-glucosidase
MGYSLSGLRRVQLLFMVGTATAGIVDLVESTLSGGISGLTGRAPVPAGYVAAPYYPAPYGGWAGDWTESYEKAVNLVSQMTLAEKVNLTAGTGQYMGKSALVAL